MAKDLNGDSRDWEQLESKSRLVTLFSKPEDTAFPKSSSSIHPERLRVEDLEVSPRLYHSTPQHLRRTIHNQERPQCSNAIQHAISSGNFTVYQGGDLNNFFGCDVFAPTRVSEVCLVNDNYILVKIPETQYPQTNVRPEMSFKTLREQNPSTETVANASDSGMKFTRYFRCGNGRSRRVSPTPTTPNIKKPWSTGGCVQEVFESRTVITGKLNVFHPGDLAKVESDTETTVESTEQTSSEAVITDMDIHRAPRQTSLSKRVQLETHGRMETAPDDFREARKISTNRLFPRPRRAFNLSICWFLRSFRLRQFSKKSAKTKKKINAVVYKTFFVNWTKPEGHSPCPNCCGIKRTLRRTRSAVF